MTDEKIVETDGDFFEELKQMERDILKKNRDEEALAYLDEEEKELAEDTDDGNQYPARSRNANG